MKTSRYLMAFACILLFQNVAHAQIPSYVPTNGLGGWWPFNGNANDESGNGNNGTVNGATLTTDRFGNPGKAYDFDGVDDFIDAGNSTMFNLNNISISLWYYEDTIPPSGSAHTMISKSTSYNNEFGYRIDTEPNGKDYYVLSQMGNPLPGAGFIEGPNVDLSKWTHIVLTKTGSNATLFKNGVIVGSNNALSALIANNSSLLFGAVTDSGTIDAYFDGKLDDIGIWNRALTPCEILGLYWHPYAYADTLTICSSYTWPVTGQTYTQSGIYSDTLQSVQGCDSIVGLELTILAPTTATLTESACGSYTLNGQTYTQSGNYTQTLVNEAGCDSVITLNLTVSNLTASVSFSGGTLTASPAGATYQWVNCELGYQPIIGSTGQSYTPDSTGNYAVVITSGPCTDTSACTSVVVVGLENGLQDIIALYPNPTDGLLNVAGLPAGATYTLTDAKGRTVRKGTASGTLSLDLSSLPAGVYTLGVASESGKAFRKVVLQK